MRLKTKTQSRKQMGAFWCGVGPQPFYQSVDGKMMRLKPHGRDIEVALISRSWSLALHFACEPSETSARVHSTLKMFFWSFGGAQSERSEDFRQSHLFEPVYPFSSYIFPSSFRWYCRITTTFSSIASPSALQEESITLCTTWPPPRSSLR